ncbi:MAG: HDIG domain-containing protein [Phycisphaeraceae bacterium]|nr:MAG: HDIG domain-containing protein [Phycisphaeraceae bacterium]
MSKEPTRSTTRTGSIARSIRAKGWSGGVMAGPAWGAVVRSPTGAVGLIVSVVFALVLSGVAFWAREQPLVSVGRVMDRTRLVRVDIVSRDFEAERQAQDAARARAPRVYVAFDEVIEEVVSSLENLPSAVASASGVEALDEVTRRRFNITPEALASLQGEASQPAAWKRRVERLGALIRARPVLDTQTFQRSATTGLHTEIKLVSGTAGERLVHRSQLLDLGDRAGRAEASRILARDAGFFGVQAQVVADRLLAEERATYREDENAGAEARNLAAAGVAPQFQRTPAGQPIFLRGQVLTAAQHDLFLAERAQFRRLGDPWAVWLPLAGVVVAAWAIALALAAYTARFVPRIRRNPGRMISSAVLLALTLTGACILTVWRPDLSSVTISAPIVLVAMVFTVAYDQRVALAYAGLLGTLACLALDRPIGDFAVLIAGIAAAVWQLREIRDRGTVVRGALVTALALAMGTAVFGLIERPIGEVSLREIALDSGLAAAGAVLAGGVLQFVLPAIERLFDVATGLTLIELRDPKQPLLREMQVRAPGTYNHSLNVAAIAEAASESIGASGLLTYVGALYHDIGKMNKPEYFVENRVGGENKHDRLSPALSLLIIVGHVKDGLELSEEFRLPRVLKHFIEAHHGTTLVEYFYHRARQQSAAGSEAEEGAEAAREPDEIEYRYPGPKPRSKEVAIVMIADAVESATRSMPDPTPSRIEALVQSIAHKRLMDGQFDECDLTLRDLRTIVDSIARTMASIYHGRIAYPGASARA